MKQRKHFLGRMSRLQREGDGSTERWEKQILLPYCFLSLPHGNLCFEGEGYPWNFKTGRGHQAPSFLQTAEAQ